MKTEQPEPTAKNHTIGDILIVRNKIYSHGFRVGQKVEIMSIGETDYKAKGLRGGWWWVADANFMTKKELNQRNK